MIVGFLDQDAHDDTDASVRFLPPEGAQDWPPVSSWKYTDWAHWLTEHARLFGSAWTKASIDRYLQHDRYHYGVGLRRHEKEALTWFYQPGPAAVPLHASKCPNILYGGAAGGMKSHSLRWDAYRHCLGIPGYRSILMRRTFEELRRNHLDRAAGECETINKFVGTTVMDLIRSEHEVRFPLNGSKIVFGHCQNLGDEEKYLGDEYDDFRPDEVATFEKQQIIGVAGRLRSTKKGVRARLIGSSNPGGAHTLWLKDWFIEKTVAYSDNPRYKPEKYQFIPAKLYDNPFLMDPDGTYTSYEERLYAYSPERRRQLLNGDWSAITGQFFPEFSVPTHVAALEIPQGCKLERWIDWGYAPNPGVCLWVACFPNGRLYVFAEWVFNGQGRTLHVASQVADRITRMSVDEIVPWTGGRLSRSIGDPSMFARDGHTGESYAETFRRFGVSLLPGDNDRVQGWGRMRHWLQPHPEGGRWMMFHPDCVYAIRTIPGLIHAANDPDDVDTTGDDHAADALRYGLMHRPSPTTFTHRPAPTLPGSIGAMMKEMMPSGPRRFGQIH